MLIAFVGWSAVRVTVGSINNYLSDIRSKHIECDFPWVNRSDMPRLQRHLNGFEWMEKATKDGRLRLPLTHKILDNIVKTKWTFYRMQKKALGAQFVEPSNYDGPLGNSPDGLFYSERPLHAPRRNFGAQHEQGYSHGTIAPQEPPGARGCTMGSTLSATLRLAEKSSPASPLISRPQRPINLGNAAIARLESFLIRQCASPRIWRGTFTFEPMGGLPRLCNSTSKWLARCWRLIHYCFLSPMGKEAYDLSRTMTWPLHWKDTTHYKGHSFRIGAATTMAFNGVPDHIIKDMGGWSRESKAFYLYVGKAPQEVRIHMSAFLARAYVPDLAYQAHEQMPRP
jgi:hypothetical protein